MIDPIAGSYLTSEKIAFLLLPRAVRKQKERKKLSWCAWFPWEARQRCGQAKVNNMNNQEPSTKPKQIKGPFSPGQSNANPYTVKRCLLQSSISKCARLRNLAAEKPPERESSGNDANQFRSSRNGTCCQKGIFFRFSRASAAPKRLGNEAPFCATYPGL